MLNPMLPSFYIARGCYRFPQRGWANFWCISILFGRTVNSNLLFESRLNHPLSKPCSAVPGNESCISVLVYAFKEKRCPGKVGHPPNQVNFSEPLQEKKKWPLFKSQCSRACSFVQISTHACSNYLALTKLTRLGEPKCFYGEMLARLGGWPHHPKRLTQLARRD